MRHKLFIATDKHAGVGMRADKCILTIKKVQEMYPKALLCGSGALILSGILPDRGMHDIDFVVNESDIDLDELADLSECDNYDGVDIEQDNYSSYVFYFEGRMINFLVFSDDIELKHRQHTVNDTEIAMQNINDILFWKRKYNRYKDIQDLIKIEEAARKAIEETMLV